jgi:putative transcriptional regulator
MAEPDLGATRLAPGLLVASPTLADPNFSGSLVLMAEHQDEGALGFVVNRAAPIAIADVLFGIDPALHRTAEEAGRAEGLVLVGGPVSPERLWILYRPGPLALAADAVALANGLALGGSRDLLEAVVGGDVGPFLLLLGYAGWAPLQIEGEVAAGVWVPLPLHEDLVFEAPLAERWELAVRRLGLDPGGFVVGGGGAQA